MAADSVIRQELLEINSAQPVGGHPMVGRHFTSTPLPGGEIGSARPFAARPFAARTAILLLTAVLSVFWLGLLSSGSVWAQARPSGTDRASAPPNPIRDPVQVPPGALDGGAEWLNTAQPLSLRDLRGKIVLLDFWTYCCINCIHILPDLKYLEEKYEKQLVVIGVHSAKFANEKLSENIRDAILRYEIRHPVVNDSDLALWTRFGVNTWPTVVLIDPEGNFAGALSGEGQREKLDNAIGRLVEYHRAVGTLDETPALFALESFNATPTPLRYPGKVLADAASGRVFISDSNHNRIVVAGFDGRLLDIIGSGRIGLTDGTYAEAEFDHPQGCALVGDMLYVADTENHAIRRVDLSTKKVSTLAGTGEQAPFGRSSGGKLLSTPLNSPWSLAHVDGTLYIAMAGPHQIWSHRLGVDRISRYAGSGIEDVTNGTLARSAFAQPSELVADADGRFLYVVDSEGSSVRRVPTGGRGLVTTVAGTSDLPQGKSLFAFGDQDGVGAQARFQHPLGIAFHNNMLFVGDSYNHKIKVIDLATSAVRTLAGTGQAGSSLQPPQLSEPGGISWADGRLFIADTNNHRICVLDPVSGEMQELLIPDLTAPKPSRSTAMPSEPRPVQLEVQKISSGAELKVLVDLAVPPGYKLNELTPITWEVYADGTQQLVAAEVLAQRDQATLSGGTAAGETAEFQLPISAETGEATLVFFVNYGYCTDSSSLCRMASAAWKVPIRIDPSHQTKTLLLKFPVMENSSLELIEKPFQK